jgi:hypothetical protein
LKQLFLKSLTLFAITSACRVSEMANLSREVIRHNTGWTFRLLVFKKNSRPSNSHLTIDIFYFLENPNLCPLKCLEIYLQRTKDLLTLPGGVFLTLSKPFRMAKTNTLAKHLKSVLAASGIDIELFKANSFRSVSIIGSGSGYPH